MKVEFLNVLGETLITELPDNIPFKDLIPMISNLLNIPADKFKYEYKGQEINYELNLHELNYESSTSIKMIEKKTIERTLTPRQMQINSLPDHEKFSSNVEELMSMGFSKELVEKALISSFNNVERAANLLISGEVPNIPLLPDILPINNNRNNRIPPEVPRPIRNPKPIINGYISSNYYSNPRQIKENYFPFELQLSNEEKEICQNKKNAIIKLHQDSIKKPNPTHQILLNYFREFKPELSENLPLNVPKMYAGIGIKAVPEYDVFRLSPFEQNQIGLRNFEPEPLTELDNNNIQEIIRHGTNIQMAREIYENSGRNLNLALDILANLP